MSLPRTLRTKQPLYFPTCASISTPASHSVESWISRLTRRRTGSHPPCSLNAYEARTAHVVSFVCCLQPARSTPSTKTPRDTEQSNLLLIIIAPLQVIAHQGNVFAQVQSIHIPKLFVRPGWHRPHESIPSGGRSRVNFRTNAEPKRCWTLPEPCNSLLPTPRALDASKLHSKSLICFTLKPTKRFKGPFCCHLCYTAPSK